MQNQKDIQIAVVGGGLCGLSAAIECAALGHSVYLFERGDLGGRARSRTTDSGFVLNQGPHALYKGQALDQMLVDAGVSVSGHAPPTNGGRCLLGGNLEVLPAGPISLLQTKALGWRSKMEVGRVLSRLPRLRPDDAATISVAEWISSQVRQPDSAALLSALVRLSTYCADLELASADQAIAQLQTAMGAGVVYVDGGWQHLVDELASVARSAGVQLAASAPVRRICGTELRFDDDQRREFDAVVVAGLRPSVAVNLVEGARDVTSMVGPAVEVATMDLGVKGVPPTTFVLGIDRPLYGSRHSPAGNLAPHEHSLHHLMYYHRHDQEASSVEVFGELDELGAAMGIGADTVVERRVAYRHRVANGFALAARGGLAGRPKVDCLEVPGVWCAGDWVGPTGVLADCSVASASEAARSVGEYLGDRVAT